jgi:hypothetical protein
VFMLLVFHELLELNGNLTLETRLYVRDCEVREGLIWPSCSRKVTLHCTSLQLYHCHLASSFLSLCRCVCHPKGTTETEIAAEQDVSGSIAPYVGLDMRCSSNNRRFICSSGWTNEGERGGRNTQQARGT